MSDPTEWQRMASKMLDETTVTQDLDAARESIFKEQMQQSMEYEGGASRWWSLLEAEWRIISGNKPVPTKYRTNKSVILKAERLNDDDMFWWRKGTNGEMPGKTAVQKACSESTPVMRTPEAVAKSVIAMIKTYERQTGPVQANALMTILNEWTKDRI